VSWSFCKISLGGGIDEFMQKMWSFTICMSFIIKRLWETVGKSVFFGKDKELADYEE
jgi:hypothetical protein